MTFRTVAFLAALALCAPAWSDGSPWLPVPKSGDVSVAYVSQSADDFWRGPDGDAKGPLPFGGLEQTTLWVQGNYGLSDALAIDMQVGTSETEPDNSPPPASDGRTDFTLGLTWRVVDEDISEAGLPSVAVRVAAVLGGSYDVGLPTAIGDGADGVDASLIVGRIFAQRIGVSGELGFRNRNDDVPDGTFLNLNGYLLLSPRLILEAQYHRTDSDGDLNICGPCGAPSPPGAPENFPLVAEELERVSVGASFQLTDQLGLGLKWFNVVDGRNTGEFDALAVNATYRFDLYQAGN